MQVSKIKRKTAETDIVLEFKADGSGKSKINSGIGFMDHMLTLFSCHGSFDLTLNCKGDTEVDDHHSAEDIGICLGKAFREALGDKKGIARYGDIILPMDEALVLAAVDISGRAALNYDINIKAKKIGNFDTELIEEFLIAFVNNAGITLHVRQLAGKNSHHIAEAVFKAIARALRKAVKVEGDAVPSSKGVL